MEEAQVQAELAQTLKDDKARQTRAYWIRVAGAVALLVAIAILVNIASSGEFLRAGNIIHVLRQITYGCILAVGETFVIITAGIDLSIGSLVSLSGVVMALFANAMGFGGVPLIIATLCVGLALGAAAGFVNAVPVVKLNLPPFITTLAMMLIAEGLSFKLSHGRPIPLNSDDFQNTGIGFFLGPLFSTLHLPGLPNPVIWMLVIVVGCSILLMRTKFGRYVFALGGNEEAARLA